MFLIIIWSMNDNTHRNPHHSFFFFFRGQPNSFFSHAHLSFIDSFIFFVCLVFILHESKCPWKMEISNKQTIQQNKNIRQGEGKKMFLWPFLKQVIFCLSGEVFFNVVSNNFFLFGSLLSKLMYHHHTWTGLRICACHCLKQTVRMKTWEQYLNQ